MANFESSEEKTEECEESSANLPNPEEKTHEKNKPKLDEAPHVVDYYARGLGPLLYLIFLAGYLGHYFQD